MNSMELNRAIKERTHFTTQTPGCPHDKCWCGLCHCDKCQIKRAAELLAAVDTGRDK